MLFYFLNIYFFIMVIVVVYLASHIRSLTKTGYTFHLTFLSLAICCYMYGYSMEISSSVLQSILFWNKVEYLGIPFISALWLSVALIYAGYYYPKKKWMLALIYVIPVITLVLRFSNSYHHLYFSSVDFAYHYGRLLLVKHPGVWMCVQAVHSMSMIVGALVLFIREFLKRRDVERGKARLMMGASCFGVFGLIGGLTDPFRIHLDYMILCLPVACALIIISILRYDFLDAKTIGRNVAFDLAEDALLLLNQDYRIIDYNRKAKQLFDQIGIEIKERNICDIALGRPELHRSLNTDGISRICLEFSSDNPSYFEVLTTPIDQYGDHEPQGWIKRIRDITEIQNLNESLRKQAMVDELSGLYNRRAFMHYAEPVLEEALHAGEPVHVLMMDLDHFKRVNDQFGHPAGDEVIRYFGGLLKEVFFGNIWIARWGGEEFCVMAVGFTDEEVKELAKKIIKIMEKHIFHVSSGSFPVTVSIGISNIDGTEQNMEKLIQVADQFLYKAKSLGRDCICCSFDENKQ